MLKTLKRYPGSKYTVEANKTCMHERTKLMTMKKRLYAYRKTPNECNSEKIKQNNYENHEIEDRTCSAERKIEHRSAKENKACTL
jgi:hypothetical protein